MIFVKNPNYIIYLKRVADFDLFARLDPTNKFKIEQIGTSPIFFSAWKEFQN